MTTQNKEIIGAGILAALAAAVYAFALNAPFYLDDQHMIVDNVFIKNPQYFSWLWKGYVTSSTIPKGMCRPILMFSFIFNYFTAGLNPIGYRILNVLIHFVNGMLLYSLTRTIAPNLKRLWLFIVAALFIAHPLASETVIYISSRSDLLAAMFTLAAITLWIKKMHPLALACYAAGLLSKETVLCVPLLCFAWDMLENKSFKKNRH